MQTKNIVMVVVGLAVVIGGGVAFMSNGKDQMASVAGGDAMTQKEMTAPVAPVAATGETLAGDATVKEFSMTSYFEMTDGKPSTHFSLKDIIVKKGDKVRIKVTNTKGMHDFHIDEYQIDEDTPLNKEVVIEFTADKAGDFVYYCAMPNHRAMGQWGTLRVTP